MSARALPGLHPLEYEHPFDTMALDALEGTPGLETLSRQFLKHGIERLFTIQYTGSNLEMTEKSCPEVHRVLVDTCAAIGVGSIPKLYVEWDDSVNAMTVGVESPIIVMTSGAVDRLTVPELTFLLGHELGHLKSQHSLYHLMASALTSIGQAFGQMTFGMANLITMPLQFSLLRWSRMSELTCDRAGLLACQDQSAAVSVFIKMAGLPEKYHNNDYYSSFVEQAKNFERLDYDQVNKWVKFLMHLYQTHPWTVMRASELLRWIESGDYEAVLERKSSGKITCRTEGTKSFCRRCGYRLEGEENFCPCCGSQLSSGSAIAAARSLSE